MSKDRPAWLEWIETTPSIDAAKPLDAKVENDLVCFADLLVRGFVRGKAVWIGGPVRRSFVGRWADFGGKFLRAPPNLVVERFFVAPVERDVLFGTSADAGRTWQLFYGPQSFDPLRQIWTAATAAVEAERGT